MKILIHRGFGGFSIPDQAQDFLESVCGWSPDEIWQAYAYSSIQTRSCAPIISSFERFQYDYAECNVHCVEVPDTATDVMIVEYDGAEYVVYVKDGKLHKVY